MLAYTFYNRPKFILRLFQIRMREVIKINLLPASVIGADLVFLVYVTGDTDNMLKYGVLFVSVLCLSVLFPVHYLIISYLPQPYNVGTEVKSATYKIVIFSIYLTCFYDETDNTHGGFWRMPISFCSCVESWSVFSSTVWL